MDVNRGDVKRRTLLRSVIKATTPSCWVTFPLHPASPWTIPWPHQP
jgi:hypothetical protein